MPSTRQSPCSRRTTRGFTASRPARKFRHLALSNPYRQNQEEIDAAEKEAQAFMLPSSQRVSKKK